MYLLTWHGQRSCDVSILCVCVHSSPHCRPLHRELAAACVDLVWCDLVGWLELLQCFSKSVEVPKHKMFVKKDLISRLVQAEVLTMTVISYRHSQPTFPKHFCLLNTFWQIITALHHSFWHFLFVIQWLLTLLVFQCFIYLEENVQNYTTTFQD